jgi:hypothetical protein
MRNEDIIIKLAKEIVNENNKVYKMSAKGRAFIIYATDGAGTQDRFITNKNDKSEADWKGQFESVGFKNVTVSPFGFKTRDGGVEGDLSFAEVTTELFNNSTNRPKINYTETPTRENPYSGSQNIPVDSRLSKPTYDSSNKLQEYIFQKLKNEEDRIRAGWYSGSLVDWLSRLASDSEGKAIKESLETEFPDMNNSMLEKHLLDRQLSLADFVPSRYDIRYFAITMRPLLHFIASPSIDFVDVPENKVKDQLNKIISSAKSFKKHKQYAGQEMGDYLTEHQKRIMKNNDDTKDAIYLMLKGMFS